MAMKRKAKYEFCVTAKLVDVHSIEIFCFSKIYYNSIEIFCFSKIYYNVELQDPKLKEACALLLLILH